MSEKIDPFKEVNDRCNSGTNPEKAKIVGDLPDLVDIELTNRCNLTCPMCPTGRKELTRPRGFMKLRVFVDLLKVLKPHKIPIRLIRWGEPMLHPSFFEFLAVAKYYMLPVHLNTNGHYLDEDTIDVLGLFGLDSIKVSIHDDDEKVANAIKLLPKLKNCYTHVSITSDEKGSHLITGTNVDKFSAYKTYWKGKEYPRLKNCPEVFNKLSVNWDGTVSACCADYDNQMIVGDLKNNSLKEIWEGTALKEYRELVLTEAHWCLPLCNGCYDLGV